MDEKPTVGPWKSLDECYCYIDGRSRTKWGYEYDMQRSKVYKAQMESGLRDWAVELKSIQEMQEYIDDLIDNRWWTDRFWFSSILVKQGRGRRSAYRCYRSEREGVIKSPPYSIACELYILHEVAHVLTHFKPHAPRGRLFVKTLLERVRRKMGKQACQQLRDAFCDNNARWYPRGKSTMLNSKDDPKMETYAARLTAAVNQVI